MNYILRQRGTDVILGEGSESFISSLYGIYSSLGYPTYMDQQ